MGERAREKSEKAYSIAGEGPLYIVAVEGFLPFLIFYLRGRAESVDGRECLGTRQKMGYNSRGRTCYSSSGGILTFPHFLYQFNSRGMTLFQS